MPKKRVYNYDRTIVTIRIDNRLLERLREVGPTIMGGYSRIVDDSIRMCLPFYECQSEFDENEEMDLERFRQVFATVLRPDCLGQAVVEACKEIIATDAKKQGRRKP